jgi:hypothetical protein
MNYAVNMTSRGMMHIPSLMTIGSGIRVILKVLYKKFEAMALVLLTREFYDVCHWNGVRGQDIYTKFNDDRFRHLSVITVITATILEVVMLVLPIEGILKYTVQMTSCGIIYIQSFMKIGTGVQAILRFRLINLRGYNVDITNGRGL